MRKQVQPRGHAKHLCLLYVQVIGVEKVLAMGGATYVDASVLRASPEEEQAEKADGEAAL